MDASRSSERGRPDIECITFDAVVVRSFVSRLQVDIRQWLDELRDHSDQGGKYAVMNAVRSLHNGAYFTLTSRYPLGTNVFEREWDLLVVLDACRVDAMRAVAPEFDFVDEVGSIWSVGSSSHEWLCKTFTAEYRDEIAETVYVSTNPNTPSTFRDGEQPPRSYAVPFCWPDWDVVDEDAFALLRQIHNHDYEEYFTTIAPDLVTDHAIHAGRTHDAERMVVHYFQPHRPYIAEAYPEERPTEGPEGQPWEAIRTGTATVAEVRELYLDNLRLALRSVERLLENTDAETVAITADHGELFGELGAYGHPEGVPHPNLKKVPWVETTATDERTSDPDVDIARQESGAEFEEQLRDLGYL